MRNSQKIVFSFVYSCWAPWRTVAVRSDLKISFPAAFRAALRTRRSKSKFTNLPDSRLIGRFPPLPVRELRISWRLAEVVIQKETTSGSQRQIITKHAWFKGALAPKRQKWAPLD